MLERFTQRARMVVVLAQQECRERGHVTVDVGHLGLGALPSEPDDALVARLRDALHRTLADLGVDHDHSGHVPFTPEAKELLDRSLRRSTEHGREHVARRDILDAAVVDPRVSAALTTDGVDVDELRAAIDAGPVDTDDTEPGGVHRPDSG